MTKEAMSPNPLNIYTGLNSLREYHNPDSSPPLPLVELSPCLNPYYDNGVRIYAKIMTALPAHNVKALPALNLLRAGVGSKTDTVIEYSSGSTVISLGILSRVHYGIQDTRAYLSNKTHLTKLRLMQFFGLKVKLFGGPSTPDANDEYGGVYAAEEEARESGNILNPNQYKNDANWKSHTLWTGPQILKQLPQINLLCAAMGTTGTMSGLGTYLKGEKPSVFCLGVCIAPGNEIPGPRMYSMIQQIPFPWRHIVDAVEEVNAADAFANSVKLSREGIVCGPSSGMQYTALLRFLKEKLSSQSLQSLQGPDGLTHCVFLACDLPYQYLDEYFDRLGTEHFPAIENEFLLDVDTYSYESVWEVLPSDLPTLLEIETTDSQSNDSAGYPEQKGAAKTVRELSAFSPTTIIDLRAGSDYDESHIEQSINISLQTLSSKTESPWKNPKILKQQWEELDGLLSQHNSIIKTNRVLLICYDGSVSRIGASILRAKGVEAFSLRGGYRGL
ncbi:uncharacterized protein N7515_003750 [Penicillium bovifimosum]|uniref:Rhodanese domain-containing protein n=1 Tax=Penicillium bovifimosum TaxID=126998 RepID=A0A9W9H590_9EURO|nr:uncharacterized protein N7515_003750 [Penicillium bovifimosum]KAJ5138902.1 hypothetical protein N7515_003750 [Penicillium bovifimosum]